MDELKKKFENKEVSTADFVKSLRDEVLTEEAKGDWFASYLKPAQDNGLLKGIHFDLSKKISREEIAQLAYNFAKRGSEAKTKENKPMSFKDEKSIDKNYLEAITCLYNKEVLKGRTDGTFSPKDMTKRSEIVVVIYRLMNLAQN